MHKGGPMLGLLIGAKPKGKAEDDTGDPAMSAAEAVMAAVKDNDVAALSEALKLHYDACQMAMGGDDYEDD